MKTDTNLQYHVTLCHPMSIKLGGESKTFYAFDARITNARFSIYGSEIGWLWHVDRIWTSHEDIRVTKVEVIVPDHNIAGFIEQPFKEH